MVLRKLRKSSIPLYVALADLLRQRIQRGQWKPGEQLPTLAALVGEFGVARVTVRQAMDVLSDEGWISRQQGRGTFVTAPPGDGRWLKVETNLEALSAIYAGTKPRLLNILDTIAAPILGPQDGVPAPRYRYMRRVHSRAEVPYCIIGIYLDARVFNRAPQRFRNEVVIPILMEMPGLEIARARQTLAIATADVETAELLRVPVNSPTAEVRRVFTAPDGTVIYLGEVTYRGDFIHLEMDLKR